MLIILGVIILDWVSKWWVIKNNWLYETNTGGAFSLLSELKWYLGIVIIILALLTGYWWRMRRRFKESEMVGLSLVLGGAVANLIDRVFRSGVVDFIKIWVFPNFNLADVAITAGLTLIILSEVRSKYGTSGTNDSI